MSKYYIIGSYLKLKDNSKMNVVFYNESSEPIKCNSNEILFILTTYNNYKDTYTLSAINIDCINGFWVVKGNEINEFEPAPSSFIAEKLYLSVKNNYENDRYTEYKLLNDEIYKLSADQKLLEIKFKKYEELDKRLQYLENKVKFLERIDGILERIRKWKEKRNKRKY